MKYCKKAIAAVLLGIVACAIIASSAVAVDNNEKTIQRFLHIEVDTSYPSNSEYTIDLGDIVYKQYGTICINGVVRHVGLNYKAEVYKSNANGEMVRVGIYNYDIQNLGKFSIEHPIGADGRYAINLKHSGIYMNEVATVDCWAVY